MLDAHRSSGLVDRVSERDVLDRLVAGVRAGQSRVLVLRGEAGVGETALLGKFSAAGGGGRLARLDGLGPGWGLPSAALQRRSRTMFSRSGHSPGPERRA